MKLVAENIVIINEESYVVKLFENKSTVLSGMYCKLYKKRFFGFNKMVYEYFSAGTYTEYATIINNAVVCFTYEEDRQNENKKSLEKFNPIYNFKNNLKDKNNTSI
jgi:hypothetical protein